MKSAFLIKFASLKWMMGITIIAVIWINFNQERWLKKDVISHDVSHYYSYLPAFFYEKDLSLSFLSDSFNSNGKSRLYWPNHTPEGRAVIKMSMGMSLSYLPFFGMAHIYAKLFNYPVDGFSVPYHFAIQFSSLFYYCIGLFFLWKILRFYFSPGISALTLFCLTFGTNVFYYLILGAGMSHLVNFALVAAFLFYTLQWHNRFSFKTACIIGLVLGLLILIRPINILVLFIFLLYSIKSFKDFKLKISLMLNHKNQLLALTFFALLVFLPQLLYWKYSTGQFLFHSYVGEHFFFDNPHIFKAIFGFRKGWLIYTPIMLFSVTGLFLLKNKLGQFSLALPIFFLIYIYVTFSWWCWWYGGSFGQRPLIDIYPLLALPFAVVLVRLKSSRTIKQNIAYSILVFFILLNLFQTIQAKYNIIHYDAMTRENYFRVFFTITKQEDREKYLIHPDYEKARRGEEENSLNAP